MDLTDFGQVEPPCTSPGTGCSSCTLNLRERLKVGCIYVMEASHE